MFLMGDEVRRTQGGNNNAYSQDNEISWFDWGRVEQQGDLFRFVSSLLRFRQGSQLFRDRRYWFEPEGTDIIWHGVRLGQPDWGENSHSLAFELLNPTDPTIQEHFYVLLNAYWEPLEFDLPELPEGRRWARLVDTGQPAPCDFSEPAELLPTDTTTYLAKSRSAVVLVEQIITQGENEP
jgi:glycogen operon protein